MVCMKKYKTWYENIDSNEKRTDIYEKQKVFNKAELLGKRIFPHEKI